jgi:predicted AlkP superfamily phosphohydrolase/phosphomutase
MPWKRFFKMLNRKNLIICLDGASWNVIGPLINSGDLPHFKNMIDSGISGRLESFEPLLSPSIWTSIVTGKKPEKHGILHFYNLKNSLTAERLWEIFENHGLKAGVAGFFLTWPPKIKNGFMIPDRYAFDTKTIPNNFSFFQDLTLNRKIGGKTGNSLFYFLKKALANGISVNTIFDGGKVFLFKKIFKPDHLDLFHKEQTVYLNFLVEIFLKCVNDYRPDLSIICIPGTDVLAHRYWKYYKPAGFEQYINKNEKRKYKDIIPNFYKKVDKVIGKLISIFPKDTNVFIISDHGFKSRESSQLFQYKIKTDTVLNYLNLSEELVYTNMGPFVILHQKQSNKNLNKEALFKSYKIFKELKIQQGY